MAHVYGRGVGHNKKLREWIDGLTAKGTPPVMNELQSGILYGFAYCEERKWIEKIQAEYGTLLNISGLRKRHLPINLLQ